MKISLVQTLSGIYFYKKISGAKKLVHQSVGSI